MGSAGAGRAGDHGSGEEGPGGDIRLPPGSLSLRAVAVDLNGIARGKRLPAAQAAKVLGGGVRMPLSALNVDIRGDDIAGSPLVFASGDADGTALPTGRGPLPMPWLDRPAALIPLWMHDDDGTPWPGDPRHALARVLDRFAARGLTPVVGTELEFYLFDPAADPPAPPALPGTGRVRDGNEILSLDVLDGFAAFFDDLYAACAAMDIPADAATSEAGPGQFEITLRHGDALKAADDAWLFRLAVRGVAHRHGLAASFMAKPRAGHSGNGLHVHFSLLDEAGRNALDDGSAEGSGMLRQAVAGCLAAMPASALVFAPHANSWRRFVADSHAPTAASWGYENRTAAIRIPGGPPAARRIEHRVAGADANPYLVLAVILGAALAGIEGRLTPPAPVTGNACHAPAAGHLPAGWEAAVDLFAADPLIADILPAQLIGNLVLTKRQEIAHLAEAATGANGDAARARMEREMLLGRV